MKTMISITLIMILSVSFSQTSTSVFREEFETFFSIKDSNFKIDVYDLKDTLPESIPDGMYTFYDISIKDSLKKENARHITGQYVNHLKEGEFMCSQMKYNNSVRKNEIDWQQLITYQNGRKNGIHKEYYISYDYDSKKNLTAVYPMITLYIEYSDNIFDGFYFRLFEYKIEDDLLKRVVDLKYYENGILTKEMKFDGDADDNLYNILHR